MAQIVNYMVHDPIGNSEGQLTDFDKQSLIDAEAQGIIFIGVHDDGTREVVRAADIVPPGIAGQELTFVMPVYVDKRTSATVECFSALAEIINPEVATMSTDGGEAEQTDPVAKFMAALENLKALESDNGGDAQ